MGDRKTERPRPNRVNTRMCKSYLKGSPKKGPKTDVKNRVSNPSFKSHLETFSKYTEVTEDK